MKVNHGLVNGADQEFVDNRPMNPVGASQPAQNLRPSVKNGAIIRSSGSTIRDLLFEPAADFQTGPSNEDLFL
jgi:hypothetical protein